MSSKGTGKMGGREEPSLERGKFRSKGLKEGDDLDRAELLHFLQDFEIIGRGDPEDMLCGVFSGCPQQLSRQEYARCLQRTALGLMPYPPDRPDAADDELREMLLQVPANIERVRLTALDALAPELLWELGEERKSRLRHLPRHV